MHDLTEEEFIALIKKSEKDADNNLFRYKFKLALFALLGYLVIIAVLAILITLVGGSIALAVISGSLFLLLLKKKVLFVILFAIWTFFKALWVKFSQPEGLKITAKQAPELFKEIDNLSKTLDSLKIHQVLITNELNAAVIQTPRFGVIGGQNNSLIIGLQLLLALPPEQMRSVLAHELGHLSGNHSSFAGWIYRIRLTWHRLMVTFEEKDSFGASLMKRFFNWYAPKFSAYSFALARNNEYEADQMAASLTSAEISVKALINVHATAPYIDKEYWNSFFAKADDHSKPPHTPFKGLANFLKEFPISKEELAIEIKEQMAVHTHYADTHPCLKERVYALSDQEVMPETFSTNTAEVWLGDYYQQVLSYYDEEWINTNASHWANRHEYATKSKALLTQFIDVEISVIDDKNLWDIAEATREFVGDHQALKYYHECFKRDDSALGAAFQIGRILASKNDLAALPFLEKSFEAYDLLEYAAHYGAETLQHHEKEKQEQEWWKAARSAERRHNAMYREISTLSSDDDFEQANITDENLENIRQHLENSKYAGSSWIAQKALSNGNNLKCYVVALKLKGFHLSNQSALNKVIEGFECDDSVFFVSFQGDSKKVAKQVKKIKQKII